MKDGDGTIQSAQLNPKDPLQGDRIALMRAMIAKIDEIVKRLNEYMDADEKSLAKALVPIE